MFSTKKCELCEDEFQKTSGNQKRCSKCKTIGRSKYLKEYSNNHRQEQRANCHRYRLKHGLIKGGKRTSWNKGMHWSEQEKEKRARKLRGKPRPKYIIEKLHEGKAKYVYTDEVRKRMSEKAKKRPKQSKQTRLRRSESVRETWNKPEIRLKQSEEVKKRYENPDYCIMMLKNSWNKNYKGGVNRRGMMYIPINNQFIDEFGDKAERHHLDKYRCIYIPKRLHNMLRSFNHNHKIQNTLNYPNFLVLLWVIANNISLTKIFDPKMNIGMFEEVNLYKR